MFFPMLHRLLLGDGSYESVQVNKGKITEIRLVNTEDAFF